VRVPPPLVFLGSIAAGVALARLVRAPLPGSRLAQKLAGFTLAVAGVSLGAQAFSLFKKSGQEPEPWKPSPSLIAEGPYRFSRNPMYVAMTTLQAGIGVAMNNAWVTLLAPLSLAIVHHTAVLPEEAYLEEKFGDDYTRLKASVPRYL
jgi:protein-S-isoprenylcysteine O-methyltransferase Ste14